MRLIEFVTHLLHAQGQTLQRLAAFFGEEEFLQMLETLGDRNIPNPPAPNKEWFQSDTSRNKNSIYAELESSVHDLKLPAVLEFHLWAYPFYRSIIESSIGLNSKIIETSPSHSKLQSKINPIEALVNEATEEAKRWVQSLPMPPVVSGAAERAAQIPWLRFRAEILKKSGKRPIRSLDHFSGDDFSS